MRSRRPARYASFAISRRTHNKESTLTARRDVTSIARWPKEEERVESPGVCGQEAREKHARRADRQTQAERETHGTDGDTRRATSPCASERALRYGTSERNAPEMEHFAKRDDFIKSEEIGES